METKKILETERLCLREFDLNDSDFILKLVNSPNWLEYIGDKNVRTNADAREYLRNGPLKSYQENGYGLWLVQLKDSNISIGMCGLVNRDTLANIDIGFAMLPKYSGFGYGFEIANATMNYAKNTLKLNKIIAITDSNNIASIKLLNKIGLQFDKTLEISKNDNVLVFSLFNKIEDRNEINKLTASFFDVFTNANRKTPNLKRVENIFIPNGILISNTNGNPEIYNLQEFITPREEILSNGTLTDFSERELSHKTDIFGNVAQRFCLYEKQGKLNGNSFDTKGVKTIQFIKVNQKWKISSVAWSDEN